MLPGGNAVPREGWTCQQTFPQQVPLKLRWDIQKVTDFLYQKLNNRHIFDFKNKDTKYGNFQASGSPTLTSKPRARRTKWRSWNTAKRSAPAASKLICQISFFLQIIWYCKNTAKRSLPAVFKLIYQT